MPAMTKPMLGRRSDEVRMMRVALGDYIKDLRHRQNMTQANLAKAVGMKYYTAISAIEVGRNTVPPERYLKFSDALDVPPRDFMEKILLLTNPWAHAMLFSDAPQVQMRDLETIPDRFAQTTAPARP